jgi:hypothetical protein
MFGLPDDIEEHLRSGHRRRAINALAQRRDITPDQAEIVVSRALAKMVRQDDLLDRIAEEDERDVETGRISAAMHAKFEANRQEKNKGAMVRLQKLRARLGGSVPDA